jgi:hypothetical protein
MTQAAVLSNPHVIPEDDVSPDFDEGVEMLGYRKLKRQLS